MISRELALDIAATAFPQGPERLAQHLSIPVVYESITGVAGWCVQAVRTVICISTNSPPSRQRFTLAHELAHLILGTTPDIATSPFQSDLADEKEADQFASHLLIPQAKLVQLLHGELPISAKRIERIAKIADVSPVMTACRIVSSTNELGLRNAAVVYLVDGKEVWRYSEDLTFSTEDAVALCNLARDAKGKPVRCDNEADGNIIVGSVIDGWEYQVLLVQLLPPDLASKESQEEAIHRITQSLFGEDASFRGSVSGCLGSIQSSCAGFSLEQAIQEFHRRYMGSRFTGDKEARLQSADGEAYLRFHLRKWFT